MDVPTTAVMRISPKTRSREEVTINPNPPSKPSISLVHQEDMNYDAAGVNGY
jgi:hypothetical protein